jgi:hypothetical protein
VPVAGRRSLRGAIKECCSMEEERETSDWKKLPSRNLFTRFSGNTSTVLAYRYVRNVRKSESILVDYS